VIPPSGSSVGSSAELSKSSSQARVSPDELVAGTHGTLNAILLPHALRFNREVAELSPLNYQYRRQIAHDPGVTLEAGR